MHLDGIPRILIRPYNHKDWDSFLTLDIQTIAASMRPDELDEEALKERWPKVLRERFGWCNTGPTGKDDKVVVLETECGQYGGHIWVADNEDIFTGRLRFWVVSIAVVEAYRGLGFGWALMQHAIQIARSRGRDSIEVSVVRSNHYACSFYNRVGFREKRATLILNLDND
jgi:ribosomal protein S18 acetylase RimI-like enzyme